MERKGLFSIKDVKLVGLMFDWIGGWGKESYYGWYLFFSMGLGRGCC